ncbi:MAG: hypothetical protein DMF71_05035 [Acidobacteria bacterium]|nr:MAG: hypothetical protein DMF71_05035 [Acidobacteriota bacterium]
MPRFARELIMKKILTLALTVTILAVAAAPGFAQGRNCRNRNYDSRNYDSRNYDSRNYDSRNYDSRAYYNSQGYYDNSRAYYDYGSQYRGQSTWDRHRDKLSVGAGTVGGAIIGSLLGGRRGAAIGALAGAGGSALYTYKLRNRHYHY